MKKTIYLFSLLCFLSLTACMTAEMVKHPNQDMNSQYAPQNEKQYGVVKYLNQGADSVIKSRREDALKQMFEACKGKYIIQEENSTFSGRYATFTTLNNSEYVYIRFECQ